ncbi:MULTISPECIES: hypothetical protein [Bacteroides]|uniref:hypothetical protein n=1 Tax=Bacteroides TaxID=816 RepID=UPI00319E8F2B
MKTTVRLTLLWMFASTFFCLAIYAQPSIEDLKAKQVEWKKDLKRLDRSYSDKYVLNQEQRTKLLNSSEKGRNDDLLQWRTLYERAAESRSVARTEWCRLKSLYVTSKDSLNKNSLKSSVNEWMNTYQSFNADCNKALDFIAKLDLDRILTKDERTFQVAKRLVSREKELAGSERKIIRTALSDIRKEYFSQLMDEIKSVPESEWNAQRDSVTLILDALWYYKRSSLFAD